VTEALFLRDGDSYLATELTRGPWVPDAQHGGPPSALLAREATHYANGADMLVTRLTVELLRPVPLAPLRTSARMLRPGKKVQLVEITLSASDTEVARAVALRIRRGDVSIPDQPGPSATGPQPPSAGHTSLPPWVATGEGGQLAFHSHAVEHRFVAGGFDGPGPSTDWIRLRVPLVAGEETPPLARVAAAADFGNGISWIVSRLDGYSFINPDLTIYLHRHPVGEWVCLEASTSLDSLGTGLAESRLWDERGPIGRSLQSLILEQTRS
jgi:hypothetical protein